MGSASELEVVGHEEIIPIMVPRLPPEVADACLRRATFDRETLLTRPRPTPTLGVGPGAVLLDMLHDTGGIVRLQRARGCLLGGAIGDALGAAVEFWDLDQIHRECGPTGVTEMLPVYGRSGGAITDDTQMTLFAAEGILEAFGPDPTPFGDDPARVVYHSLREWHYTQTEPFEEPAEEDRGRLVSERWLWDQRAPGTTCMASLSHPLGRPTRSGYRAKNRSKGCGTVMRSAPFGFIAPSMALAAESSFHTHGHPTAAVSSAFLAQVIARLLGGVDLVLAITETRTEVIDAFPTTHDETTNVIDRALDAATHGPPDPTVIESLGGGWIAEEALAISFLLALTATGWRDALTRAVTHSGDSDSTGSITGNLLGACWGDADLPDEWLAQLEGRETIERIATRLADLGNDGSRSDDRG